MNEPITIRELNITNEKLIEAEAAFEILDDFMRTHCGEDDEDTEEIEKYLGVLDNHMGAIRTNLHIKYKSYLAQLQQEYINTNLKRNGLDHLIK